MRRRTRRCRRGSSNSTPPPIVSSCWPLITCAAAKLTEVEARGAEAVDLHARHGVAKARGERAHPRDVAARFADRIDAAHDDVVDVSADRDGCDP